MEELIKIIEETSSLDELRLILNEYQPYDIALVLDKLSDEAQAKLEQIYQDEELAEIISYADPENATDFLDNLKTSKTAQIIEQMEPDDAIDVLQEMDEDDKNDVTSQLSNEALEEINKLDKFDENEAGSIMTSNYLEVLSNTSVKDAMKILVKNAPLVETINTLFVVDSNKHLLGTIDLKKLICARMPHTVNDIMVTNYQAVSPNDNIEDVVDTIKEYDIFVLPVIKDDVLVGIITMDDAFDTLTENAEEDYAKLAGLVTDEDRDESIIGSIKKRFPWLLILLFLDLIIALTISRFNHVIEKLTVLTFFQAAVLGLAGNCGTQSLAVTVRKISKEELNSKKSIGKYLLKEVFNSFLLGLILGFFAFIMVCGILFIKNDLSFSPVLVGIVLGISVFVSCIFSNLIGALLPIFFEKIHIDPCVASGPFITTLNDVVAILIYFETAIIILNNYL